MLGFTFWAFAAREFSQQAVGYGSAAISAMTLLGTVGVFGLGTVLIGELPRRSPRAGLVSAALLACGIGSLLLGLAFAVGPRWPASGSRTSSAAGPGRDVRGRRGADGGDLGLRPGDDRPAARGSATGQEHGVRDQQDGGTARHRHRAARSVRRRDNRVLDSGDRGVDGRQRDLAAHPRLSGAAPARLGRPARLGKTTLAHNWLNLAIAVPVTLIPVLVTVVVSPAANAAFYVAWMVTSFLVAVPVHLSTVLFAIASADPRVISRKLRFALKVSLWAGIPGDARALPRRTLPPEPLRGAATAARPRSRSGYSPCPMPPACRRSSTSRCAGPKERSHGRRSS